MESSTPECTPTGTRSEPPYHPVPTCQEGRELLRLHVVLGIISSDYYIYVTAFLRTTQLKVRS